MELQLNEQNKNHSHTIPPNYIKTLFFNNINFYININLILDV